MRLYIHPHFSPTSRSAQPLPTDSRALRDAFARFPTGVTVVTALDPLDKPIGVTISSFNSVSLHPPLALWSLAQQSSNRSAFFLGSSHVIHVLAEGQAVLAKQFSSRMHDRFHGVEIELNEHRVPMVKGCSAYFECTTEACYPAGDHVIVVSRIQKFHHHPRPPLVFHGSTFKRLVEHDDSGV